MVSGVWFMDKQLARLFLLLSCAASFAQIPPAVQSNQGKTYYVDAVSGGGSDANPGTAASPFATVNHVASIAPNGLARVWVRYPNLSWQFLSMPYLNLKYLFIGQQGSSATTAYDVANGNNATIANGAWVTAANNYGLVCNGTTTSAPFTPVIGNSNFIAYTVANGSQGNSGMSWAEGNTGNTNAAIYQGIAWNGTNSFIRDASSHGGAITGVGLGASGQGMPHIYFLSRNGTTAGFSGLYDLGTSSTLAMTSVSMVTNTATLCARVSSAGIANFWNGTLTAVAIYTVFPSTLVSNAQYQGLLTMVRPLGIRMALVSDRNTLSAGPVWVRQGAVTGIGDPANGNFSQEPNVLPIANPVILTGQSNVLGMEYSWLNGLGYAESTDGINWTDHGSAIITAHRFASALQVGSTFYIFATKTSNQIDVYSGPDFLHMTLLQGSVITLGSAGQPDSANIYNSNARYTNGLWQLSYDCSGTVYNQQSYAVCLATASAPQGPWTKVTYNAANAYDLRGPVSGPYFTVISGKYWYWGQTAGPCGAGTDIYRGTSESFGGLGAIGLYPQAIVYPRGSVGETKQVGDPSLLEISGSTYMWYSAVDVCADNSTQHIKLAIAPMTMQQLVTTTEGATTTSP